MLCEINFEEGEWSQKIIMEERRRECPFATERAIKAGTSDFVECTDHWFQRFGIKGACGNCSKGNRQLDKGVDRLSSGEHAASSIVTGTVERAREKHSK